MVLQRIETVASLAHDDKAIDVYELRVTADGPPVCHKEKRLFDEIRHRPAFVKALGRLARPVTTLIEDEEGFLTLRIFTTRSGGRTGLELIAL